MKKSDTAKLLSFLGRNAGEKLSLKDIRTIFATKKDSKKDKKKKKRKGLPFFREVDDFEMTLTLDELQKINLVEKIGPKFIPRKPFVITGKVSMSPRGMIFVSAKGADSSARDIFVPPRDSQEAMTGDEVIVRIRDRSRDRFEGEVVSILKRARKLYRMKILEKPGREGVPGELLDSPGAVLACMDVGRIPADTVARFKPDQVVVVRLTNEASRFMNVVCKKVDFVRFEDDIDMDLDFARILMKYDLDPVYPDDIELPEIVGNEIDETTISDWKSRRDCRDMFTITIDGADSKDFDDAISIEPGPKKGQAKLYVHIADVSYYVKQGSDLDQEALARATSVYLVNRVVPMLPPVLSENLCSLVSGVNRLSFTAEMDIDLKKGTIVKSDFYKSIIKVNQRLTYTQAEDYIDMSLNSDRDPESVYKTLAHMWELASILRERRLKDGRIDLNLPEPKIIIGEDDTVKEFYYPPSRLKSSMLIEEFMLSANQAVARYLTKKNANVLYRVHEPMDETKIENLNNFFRIYNVAYDLFDTKAESIAGALKVVKTYNTEEHDLERIFNLTLLRTFMQADYRGEPKGHWGLAFKDYTHFTSPIRRYPDLVVHRVLGAILARDKQPYTEEEIDELGEHTSDRERKAMEAERDMYRLKVIRHIEQSGQKQFRGFLTGFKLDRVFLELEDFPAEGVVLKDHLTNAPELILPDRFSVFVKKLSRPAFLGEEWNLELERIDIEEIRLYFKPIWKGVKKAFK